MDQFTRILGALEHPPEIVERLNLSFSVPFVTPESTFGRSRCDALAAYRAHAVEMNRITQDALSISAWFAREFASARSSAKLLRRLRRELAWRIHPDRGDRMMSRDDTLAKLNAELDDALERLKIIGRE